MNLRYERTFKGTANKYNLFCAIHNGKLSASHKNINICIHIFSFSYKNSLTFNFSHSLLSVPDDFALNLKLQIVMNSAYKTKSECKLYNLFSLTKSLLEMVFFQLKISSYNTTYIHNCSNMRKILL